MADIIADLAAKAGISPEMASKGMGAVLSVCRGKLSPDTYNQLSKAVPDGNALADASDDADTGIFGSLTGAIGKMLGGGGAGAGGSGGGGESITQLASKLSASGFSVDQIKAFLPQVLAFLKDKLPADALQKLSGMLPAGFLNAGQSGQGTGASQ